MTGLSIGQRDGLSPKPSAVQLGNHSRSIERQDRDISGYFPTCTRTLSQCFFRTPLEAVGFSCKNDNDSTLPLRYVLLAGHLQ